MMGVPPPSQRPPSSGGDERSERSEGPDKKKPKKDFRLPGKKGKDEEEKKGLFDLTKEKKKAEEAAGLGAIEERVAGQQMGKEMETMEVKEAAKTAETEAVSKVAKLIMAMVDKLQTGQIGGKEFASLDLKAGPEVPGSFAGSTLTLEQTEQGLVIRFTNFESPQQQAAAIHAVEQNKEQLQQMMMNLQTRNVLVAQLHIGDQQIALPRITEAAPLEAPPMTAETRQERERREGEGGGERGGEEGAGPGE